MGPSRRFFQIVLWPIVAATIIIGMLYVFERDKLTSVTTVTSRWATTGQLGAPWTLSDEEQRAGKVQMTWADPSLKVEPPSQNELTDPYPPYCRIQIETSSTTKAGDIAQGPANPFQVASSRPVPIEGGGKPSTVLGDKVGLSPSIMNDDTSPKAALHAPQVDEAEELAGLPDPKALEESFDSMQLTRDRLDAIDASPRRADEPVVRPGIDRGLQKSAPQLVSSEWPKTPALIKTLDEASSLSPETRDWSSRVTDVLQQLQTQPKLSSAGVETLLIRLERLASEAYIAADNVDSLIHQRVLLSSVYALQRRVEVWKAIWNNLIGEGASVPYQQPVSLDADVRELVASIREQIKVTGDEDGWISFLLLDQMSRAVEGELRIDERRLLAQRYLSRVEFSEMTEVQRSWFNDSSCPTLARVIKPWVHGPVDYVELLNQIETQEEDSVSRKGSRIAWTVQTLKFGQQEAAYEVAETINKHYRNANVRLSMSQEMLRRLLPDVPQRQDPIRDQILGARVRGTSYANTNLDVSLMPDDSAWKIRVGSFGTINSETWSHQGPAKLNHIGNASFSAGTAIRIDRTGVEISDPAVNVSAENRLRRMRTQYDGFPVVGPLVREYVYSRNRQSRGFTQRYSEFRMRQQIGSQISESVAAELNRAEADFSARVIGPLAKLQLTPTVVDLFTSEQRLTVRYRLSGDWQLAAFTPRPRAPTACLMSVQIHQSALNNALEQLVPKGTQVSIEELAKRNLRVFGFETSKLSDDLPNDTMIRFTSSRPVTIQVLDEKVQLTLRIVRLSKVDGVSFRNFIVRATYVPQIEGVRPMLVREDHLGIAGPRMSIADRVAIRAIFNKVLSPTRPLDLTSEELRSHAALDGLAITQFELRDGWIGFALGNEVDFLADADLYSEPILR